MKEIQLTQGKVALVDDADYEWLNQWQWCAHVYRSRVCAVRTIVTKGKYTTIIMARVILDAPSDKQVDHINLNALDNRRCNLRLCNNSQNHANIAKLKCKSGTLSKYKGVTRHFGSRCSAEHPWEARIKVKGIMHSLGTFTNPEDAALAYNNAAIKYHGEFARLNEVVRDCQNQAGIERTHEGESCCTPQETTKKGLAAIKPPAPMMPDILLSNLAVIHAL